MRQRGRLHGKPRIELHHKESCTPGATTCDLQRTSRAHKSRVSDPSASVPVITIPNSRRSVDRPTGRWLSPLCIPSTSLVRPQPLRHPPFGRSSLSVGALIAAPPGAFLVVVNRGHSAQQKCGNVLSRTARTSRVRTTGSFLQIAANPIPTSPCRHFNATNRNPLAFPSVPWLAAGSWLSVLTSAVCSRALKVAAHEG